MTAWDSKIAALLAKAESTTPAEAEALTAKAEQLMVKYGIQQAQLDAARAAKGERTEPIVHRSFEVTGVYRVQWRMLAHAVSEGLGTVKMLYKQDRWNNRETVYLVGFASDVAAAETLWRSLQLQATTAMRAWWAQKKADGTVRWLEERDRAKLRRNFLLGFGNGVWTRLRETRRVETEAAGTGTDLVLVGRRQLVDDWYADQHGQPRTHRGPNMNGAGSGAGYAAGKQADVGQARVGAAGMAAIG